MTVRGDNPISDLMPSHQGGILTAGAFLTGPHALTDRTKPFRPHRYEQTWFWDVCLLAETRLFSKGGASDLLQWSLSVLS